MKQALIGHTGFVGSNLCRQAAFSHLFNSSNINTMRGQHFDRIVCAGLPAAKWQINQHPEKDLANIALLQSVLDEVTTDSFWLVSTVDIYPNPSSGGDENAVLDGADNHAYGRHRLAFEHFICDHFDRGLIVRLPGLYGLGLKKNIIYDLQHDNCLEMINPNSAFQWYGLERIWGDMQIAAGAGISTINLMPEPLATSEILAHFFPHKHVGTKPSPVARYDIRTCYADLFGGRGKYIQTKEQVLNGLAAYLAGKN